MQSYLQTESHFKKSNFKIEIRYSHFQAVFSFWVHIYIYVYTVYRCFQTETYENIKLSRLGSYFSVKFGCAILVVHTSLLRWVVTNSRGLTTSTPSTTTIILTTPPVPPAAMHQQHRQPSLQHQAESLQSTWLTILRPRSLVRKERKRK